MPVLRVEHSGEGEPLPALHLAGVAVQI